LARHAAEPALTNGPRLPPPPLLPPFGPIVSMALRMGEAIG